MFINLIKIILIMRKKIFRIFSRLNQIFKIIKYQINYKLLVSLIHEKNMLKNMLILNILQL